LNTRIRCLAPLLLLLTVSAHAQEVKLDEAKVDAYIRTEMEKRNVPGASVVVVRDGKVALSKGYGLANVEHGDPARPDTVYQLASVTKQFTAAATLLLMEDGKLSLDDYISKHLPNTPPAWSGVTVRHLLNHTSGIQSYTSLQEFEKGIRRDYTHGLSISSPAQSGPTITRAISCSG
jgi:D-alanyl-D-alanine carboxypeptidase